MKEKFCLILLMIFWFSFQLEAQNNCPKQGVPILETQEKIDSFLAIYPGCEYIQGFRAVDNVRIYWVKEERGKYFLFLSGVLVLILGVLKLIFKRTAWFG